MTRRFPLFFVSVGLLGLAPVNGTGQDKKSAPEVPKFAKETFVYKKVGPCEIKADVYRTPGDDVRPAILWIHGGALISGQRTGINPKHLHAYLREGFAVVAIDYRLAPETKLPAIIADLEDSYRWLRKEANKLHIDAARVAVVGHSAGGYLTLMAGCRFQPPPRALVPFYGYGDLLAEWYTKPEPFYVNKYKAVTAEEAHGGYGKEEIAELDKTMMAKRGKFYLYCRQNGVWPKLVGGFDPVTEAKKFEPYCPVKNVTKAYPPTLLLHGTADTDVPYSQSVQMAEELKKHNVPHELITMEKLGHGFDYGKGNPAVDEAFAKVLAFLKKNTAK